MKRILLLIGTSSILLASYALAGQGSGGLGGTEGTSGGGGTGQMTTNTINTVTSGAFGLSGSWTNFGNLTESGIFTATSNVNVTSFLGVNTNHSTRDLVTFLTYPQLGKTYNIAYIAGNVGSYDAALEVGDAEEAGSLYWSVETARATNKILMRYTGGGFSSADIYMGPDIMMNWSRTILTFGKDSSSALNFLASTLSIPSGLDIGAGQWKIPSSGYITNSGTGVYIGGNLIVQGVQTNNATLVTSNIIMRGGMVFARSEKTANYTNTINDYMISWKGTTVAAPTNFLQTGLLNGRTYVIKDGQRSAATTNIVVKPLGSDTIGGSSSYTINVNGQAITITYDGTSNWELN